MATPFDFTNRDGAVFPHDTMIDSGGGTVRLCKVFNIAEAVASNGTAALANDVFQVFSIPAGWFVHSITVQVVTAEGAASTIDVGDGATADGYHDGIDMNSTSTYACSFDTDGTPTEAFGHGKFYSTADTIDLKVITGTWTHFVVKLTVIAFNTTCTAS
jgi:hypothetical protein